MHFSKLFRSGLLALAAVTSLNAVAGSIDANSARMTANSFWKQKAATGMFKAASNADFKLTYTEKSSVSGNAFYVFNIDGGGWVIVSGDDRAKQVLAYGDKGNIDMNDLPCNMESYLTLYKNQIEEMQSYKGEVTPIKAAKSVTPIAPMTKATWGQQQPMNTYCPYNGSSKTSVGCGPLAMAQIMYYWKYPEGSPAMEAYYVYYPGCGSVPALEATTFDYSLMLDTYTIYNPSTGGVSLGTFTEEQGNEVGKLCRYAGHACKARYGNSGTTSTGAYSQDQRDAFKFFGYNDNIKLIGIDPAYYCDNSNKYSEEDWKALIYSELAAGHPIPYHNLDPVDGHAWIIDGVDADGLFHMNWGFYERFNGWFEFGAFTIYPNGETWNFNGSGNEMVINCIPYEGYVIPGDEPQGMRGDVNMNNEVSIADVTALIDYLLGGDASAISLDNADCNLDTNVTIADVTKLIDYLLSGNW